VFINHMATRIPQMIHFHSKSYPTTLAKELNREETENQFKSFSSELKPKFNPYFEVTLNTPNQFQLQFDSRHTWLSSLLSVRQV